MSKLTKAEIDLLVAGNADESKTLEFKSAMYSDSKDGTKEFLKDVTAFANSQGGLLLIGISEQRSEDGIVSATSADGVDVSLDQFKQKYENKLRDNCDPPLNSVNIYGVEGFPQGRVIVLDIPRSWIGPHRVRISEQSYFYLRTSSKAEPMDSREIRQSFQVADSLTERIKRWRAERVGLISVGQGQIRNVTTGMAVVHVIPLESFTESAFIDVTASGLRGALPFAFEGGALPKLNFDGILSTVMPDRRKTSYSQLFRNGVFEGVTEVGNTNGPGGTIAAEHWENQTIDYVLGCLTFLSRIGLSRNIIISLSLTGCHGRTLYMGRKSNEEPIDRDILLLPEIELQDTSGCMDKKVVRQLLAPAFDVAYQAVGIPCSPYSKTSGEKQ